jgi:hypothetical protein
MLNDFGRPPIGVPNFLLEALARGTKLP